MTRIARTAATISALPLMFLLLAAHVAQAQRSLFNSRVPKEAIYGNNNGDSSARCLQTVGGWLQITGYISPGDGFRHTVAGRCMEDGTVLILQDYPYPEP